MKDARRDFGLASFGARGVRRERIEHGERPMNGGRLAWRVADGRPINFRGSWLEDAVDVLV